VGIPDCKSSQTLRALKSMGRFFSGKPRPALYDHGEFPSRAGPRSALRHALAAILLLLTIASLETTSAICQTPTEAPGRTWALVIGISQYSKLPGGQQLQDAENDARAFANVLQLASGVDLQSMWLLIGPGATQTSIKTALGSWLARQSSDQDTVYIFFSGHGTVERDFGASYWLAYDSDPKNVDATAISVDDLKHALSRIKARRVFIVQDSVRRDLFDPDSTGPADVAAYEKSFTNLAQSTPGLTCLLASGPAEFSREGRRWKDLGVFTKFLVDGMSGYADRNKDGVVTDEELFDFLAERIPQETNQKQHPWRTASSHPAIAVSRPHSRSVTVSQSSKAGQSPAVPVASQQPKPATIAADQPVGPPVKSALSSPAPTGASPPPTTNNVPATVAAETARTQPASSISSAASVNKPRPDSTSGSASNAAAGANQPPPVRELSRPTGPPSVANVPVVAGPSKPAEAQGMRVDSSTGPAPSPLPLQLEAAIAAGHLIDPKNGNAWDLYQQFARDQSSYEIQRFKDLLAAALLNATKKILVADALQDDNGARSDEIKRAGEMLVRLHTLKPSDDSVAYLQKLGAIESLIALQFFPDAEKALSQMPSPATAPIENARGLVYVGELSEWQAERSFKRAIEVDSAWAAPHYNLALLYKSQGKDDALGEFEQAAKLAPSNASIQAGLGDEYFALSRWAEAVAAYKQAITVDPNNDVLHTKLGHSLYSQGMHEEADREYQRARELAAKNR
jgi:tetratricopeptide (TPR) repeat protein/uncharacterized caspase-like protein